MKEVAMKMSVFSKATTFALLIALVLASLPMTSVVAKGNNGVLEQKWDQLVTNFNTQSSNHTGVHKWVDHWLQTHKKASVSDKAEVQKHLAICNSAILSAGAIVSKHAGFDAKGNVIDKASAIKSVDNLAYFLRQHAGSVKNLKEHIRK
jgi:hypothetical protein